MTTRIRNVLEDQLLRRVYGEFLEMPGLRLSAQQAQRLWGLDERTCQELLEFLVEARFLCRHGHGIYSRFTEGFAEPPRLRMARAGDSNFRGSRARMTMPEDDIRMAAATHVPVLITCDSAPERERCARLIHGQSRGNDGPFVTCRGNRSLRQPFDQARGGTLFIEDIVALTADAQLELLSLLDERIRQGCDCAVRILAGASRHVEAERRSGAFSERLFYRLNPIHLDFNDEQSIRLGDMATARRA